VPGPWIAVHGAVLTDAGWVFQPLTDLVNLQFDPYNHHRMLNVARLFLALRESLQELDTFYKGIKHQTRKTPSEGRDCRERATIDRSMRFSTG
jgi:hypothetical protein